MKAGGHRLKGKAVAEEWRAAVGWEGLYEVSSLGQVRGVRRAGSHGRALFQGTDNKGYRQVGLYRNQRCTTVKVHRLVACAFLGPRGSRQQVNHRDCVKAHNEASNLEYVSALENVRHAIENGLFVPDRERMRRLGRANGRFTPEQVREIRLRAAAGETRAAIAAESDLHVMTVGEIVRREIYSWVS